MPHDRRERDEAIRTAVVELLRSSGPRAVNIEAVAALAGIAKTTIYRRFSNREEMIAAALTSLTDPPPPPDTRALRPVLEWIIEQSFHAIEAGIGLGGVAALLTDDDERFTALIRKLLVEHRAALAAVAADAAAAGQMRADLDVDTLLDCIAGAYMAERARTGSIGDQLAQNVFRTLLPAVAAQ